MAAGAPLLLREGLLHSGTHRPEERCRGGGARARPGWAGKATEPEDAGSYARGLGPRGGRAGRPVGDQGGRIAVPAVDRLLLWWYLSSRSCTTAPGRLAGSWPSVRGPRGRTRSVRRRTRRWVGSPPCDGSSGDRAGRG